MSFVSLSASACRALALVLAAGAFVALAGGSGYAADSRSAALPPSPKPLADTPSGVELVGKLLAERSTGSDPDIPLPQRNLTVDQPAFVPLTGPQIYGKRDEGSVVLGFKIPIPADRGARASHTRYGGDTVGRDMATDKH
jgi:hypothetical protein